MSFSELEHNPDRLEADPGEDHAFYVVDNPFAFSPGQLSEMFNPKSIADFGAVGGLQGLVQGLRTDCYSGLGLDETRLDGIVTSHDVPASTGSGILHYGTFPSGSLGHPAPSSSVRLTSSEKYADRRRVFGDNRLPEKKAKNLFQIMWITFNDKVLIILTTVAAISLVLGLYQDFGENASGPKVRWVEGVTIMVAVIIVVVVGSINDYQKERQFIKLNKTVCNFPHA
jgi:P-type Ca2+ transporter type 2C